MANAIKPKKITIPTTEALESKITEPKPPQNQLPPPPP
jgi:hypothetical protein